MCLVEIEGMPKLQTACTTPAADGMIVRSQSDRAREGQDAVLEFLLINHPLDCPVCDKGGECPLQDLTFRYGPGSTRMTLPKRTHDKPIPISPLIKLDRDRCILCYRCTRFSEGVSGDLQLVTENRGANSVITTFEGRPYDGEFSGNVTELCPVGALTSTTYRFRGRPWEIQNVPTVCGHCAVGCNTYATIREGRVARVLSRNHPAIDEGWLCDKGRYVHTALDAPDRIRVPMIRAGRGLEEVAPTVALDHVADRLRATVERFGPGSVAVLASGEQTNEEAHLWARLQAEVFGGGPVVCGPEGGCRLGGARAVLRPDLRPGRCGHRSSSPAPPRSPTGCPSWSCGSARLSWPVPASSPSGQAGRGCRRCGAPSTSRPRPARRTRPCSPHSASPARRSPAWASARC